MSTWVEKRGEVGKLICELSPPRKGYYAGWLLGALAFDTHNSERSWVARLSLCHVGTSLSSHAKIKQSLEGGKRVTNCKRSLVSINQRGIKKSLMQC
jgi:hypothetical protein